MRTNRSGSEPADGPAVTVLDGHRDEVRGPFWLGLSLLDHSLHSDVDDTVLERLHQIVQVINLPFGEDDEHFECPFHNIDGVAFGLVVLASAFYGK